MSYSLKIVTKSGFEFCDCFTTDKNIKEIKELYESIDDLKEIYLQFEYGSSEQLLIFKRSDIELIVIKKFEDEGEEEMPKKKDVLTDKKGS